ncbi:MAG: hypothetical protein DKT66_02085 [Candidatus Melainabacteria bacterium]|nr:MAG: hypothetical protein DKT66_02085 [Candidatus Melainabacteria bacterium]
MKKANKKLLSVATALSILLIAAQEVHARGVHDVRTDSSTTLESNDASMGEMGTSFSYSEKQPKKKFIAHKKKKTSKSKRSKDRTTSNLWMFEGKNT